MFFVSRIFEMLSIYRRFDGFCNDINFTTKLEDQLAIFKGGNGAIFPKKLLEEKEAMKIMKS